MKNTYDFSHGKRGAVLPATSKTRITIHLDNDVLEAFRRQAAAQGKGYQTLINEALRLSMVPEAAPVTIESLRQVLREELHAAWQAVSPRAAGGWPCFLSFPRSKVMQIKEAPDG